MKSLRIIAVFLFLTVFLAIHHSRIFPDMGKEESEPTPQAIVEPISGVLYPGMGDSYGRFFEIKGAPIYVTVNWIHPTQYMLP